MSDSIPRRLRLEWAKQIQSISQAGLAYSKDMYDLERFEMLRELSVDILARYTEVETEKIKSLFAGESGYATPKVDVRGANSKKTGFCSSENELTGLGRFPAVGRTSVFRRKKSLSRK